jgi:pimeloyl-ACP methyl ester carboxylesterase
MKTNYLLIAILLFTALLLPAYGAPATTALAVPPDVQSGDLTGLKECEYSAPGDNTKYRAECGTLAVPENWDVPGSRLITLPVVRIPASGLNPAEPVFWLVGGPGGTNLSWAPPEWLLQKHDVVLVGYRGVDGSVVLSCPEITSRLKTHLGKDLWSKQASKEYAAGAKQCAARFQTAGADLSGYSIPGVVRDMEAARMAFGYDKINLFSESYGTRVAQIYAYMQPDSLHRVVQVGVNTPGHFIFDPAILDTQIGYLGKLCAQDATCSSRTSDLAQTMYAVNHNMPQRWLFLPIDADTIRLGSQFMLASNQNVGTVADAYLAAAHGDPSGLALCNLLTTLMFNPGTQILGEYFSIGASTDREKYGGKESISLGDSIMGAPLSELIWPLAVDWPVELIPKELREFQDTDVEMLLVNGTLDVATPATDMDEAKAYFHKAQMVLLPEFSHVGDEYTLQPRAWERLITSYYDTGVADSSLYVYQPVSFQPAMNTPLLAKVLVATMILVLALIIFAVVLVVRRIRRRRSSKMPAVVTV